MKRGAPEVSSCQLISKLEPETSTEWAMMLPNTETFDEADIWISPRGANMRPLQLMSLPLNWIALTLQAGGLPALENMSNGE